MEKQKQPQRLQSLDVLRGLDMFSIMGGHSLLLVLATSFPNPFFLAIAEQMEHVEWNGLHLIDIVFPLFLFIAGISFPFSLAKQREHKVKEADIYKKIISRGLMLVLLGFIYNGLLDFDFEHQRYASVLGRIGLALMFASLIFVNTRTITRIWITGGAVDWLLAITSTGACARRQRSRHFYNGGILGGLHRPCFVARTFTSHHT